MNTYHTTGPDQPKSVEKYFNDIHNRSEAVLLQCTSHTKTVAITCAHVAVGYFMAVSHNHTVHSNSTHVHRVHFTGDIHLYRINPLAFYC